MSAKYVIGVDYGTDSVRSVLIDTANGECIASKVHNYQRWKEGKYCDPSANQFRQHPKDYLEGLESTIKGILEESAIDKDLVTGICVDTTGSTPVAVNRAGTPLSLTPEFEENPNAMFVLWKDHTALNEAEEINKIARSWGGEDYTRYEGGIYSSEWFWAKILHVIREDEKVHNAAFSWLEHCDWITGVLIGSSDVMTLKRSRCAAGHKAMWHESWGGLPAKEFLAKLDPRLADLKDNLYKDTYTSDQAAGKLCSEWADMLGLSQDVEVAVGTFDAHAGAVGGEVEEFTLVKVMGTSTCDIIVSSNEAVGDNLVNGICGQVDGSVIPGMVGLEAGQSAFGDVLAWYKNLLSWPVNNLIGNSELIDENTKKQLIEEVEDKFIATLSDEAAQIPVSESGIVALDWINGRRTPDANQALKGAIMGLSMGSDAPRVFRALVEAICFGSKKIVDRFEEEGVKIKNVVGLGGVAKKSKFVMQTMADVLDMPIKVAKSEQAPALGAAIYAAVASGIFPDVQQAKVAMGNGFDAEYHPQADKVATYQKLYEEYNKLGAFVEENTK